MQAEQFLDSLQKEGGDGEADEAQDDAGGEQQLRQRLATLQTKVRCVL